LANERAMNGLSMAVASAPRAAIDASRLRGLAAGLVAASHAAVFPFTAMGLMGTLMSAVFLGDRLTPRELLGIIVVVSGLVVLSGLDPASLSGRALLGDLLFVGAGSLWAGFGIVMRQQRLDPLLATAVISFAALTTYVPVYLGSTGLARLLAAAPTVIWTELLVQGLIAGAGTLYTYSKMVSRSWAKWPNEVTTTSPVTTRSPTWPASSGLCRANVSANAWRTSRTWRAGSNAFMHGQRPGAPTRGRWSSTAHPLSTMLPSRFCSGRTRRRYVEAVAGAVVAVQATPAPGGCRRCDAPTGCSRRDAGEGRSGRTATFSIAASQDRSPACQNDVPLAVAGRPTAPRRRRTAGRSPGGSGGWP